MDKKHFITRSKLTIIFICLIILLDQIIKAIAISITNEGTVEAIKHEKIEDLKKLTNFENTKKVLDTIKLELPETPNINDIKLIKLNREKVEIKASTALSLVLAGGISNLIDRIFRGRSSRLYRHISYY